MNFVDCFSFSIYRGTSTNVKMYLNFASKLVDHFCNKNNTAVVIFADDFFYKLLSHELSPHPSFFLIQSSAFDSIRHHPPKIHRHFAHLFVSSDWYHYRDVDVIFDDKHLYLLNVFRSDAPILLFRPEAHHIEPILAGYFSVKSDSLYIFDSKFFRNSFITSIFSKIFSYRYDQILLSLFIYPKLKRIALVLTSHVFFNGESIKLIHKDFF